MLLEEIRIFENFIIFTENFNSAQVAPPTLQTNAGATSERRRRRHEVDNKKNKINLDIASEMNGTVWKNMLFLFWLKACGFRFPA